jgi:CRP-like cAMP-binding protein
MYYDVNEALDGKIINAPFNLYVEGSYFGDSEIFISDDRNSRDCTAIAETECQLLVITRKELIEILKRFRKVATEMREIAFERKKHHERGIK